MAYALISHTTAATADTKTVTTGAIDTTGATDIYITLSDSSGVSLGTMSDSKSNTWTAVSNHSLGGTRATIWEAHGVTAGSGHTFSYTTGASASFPAICISAWSGGLTTNPFDAEIGQGQTSGTSIQSGASINPAQTNEIIIASLNVGGSGAGIAIDSGMTILDTQAFGAGNNYFCALGYIIQTSIVVISPKWSWTTSSAASMGAAAFKVGTAVTTGPGRGANPGKGHKGGPGSSKNLFGPTLVVPWSDFNIFGGN